MTATLTKPRAAALTDPMLPRPFTVASTIPETHDTITLVFEAAAGGPPLEFAPGQFAMIYVHGVGEVPITIAGDPASPERLIQTVRGVGAVTNAICALKAGDSVGIRGPFGTTWPKPRGRDLLIVAGGIGLPPVRPLIYHALRNRDQYSSLGLAYGARTPSDLLYRDELDAWSKLSDFNVEITVDSGDDTWHGEVGLVTPMVERLVRNTHNPVVVICGPELMMKAVAGALGDLGVPHGDMYVSLERNIKCGIGFCGHCQIGPDFVCKDGPVSRYSEIVQRLGIGSL